MSKYDFEVDLSQNSSTGIILNKIRKGSTVLEFGCAAGRMTRYMKEVLGCQVYIVEYDKGAYETALEYAEDGLCDDILTLRWTEKFKGKKFDAIIFADVLEHLTFPEKILERAAEFLKEDGKLYVSIPNVTHNDVLLKAYEERFDYTPTGILDDTHVHFWGKKNIAELARRSGLHIERVEATYCATGHTEQCDLVGERNLLLENILKQRLCGEVYQFVITLQKKNVAETVYHFQRPSIQSCIYLDTGSDFNTDEIIALEAEASGQGSYTVRYELHNAGNIKRVRFDPVEQQSCILRKIKITQGDKELKLVCPGGVKDAAGLYLPGEDPMVYVNTLPGAGVIVIEAEIVLGGVLFLAMLQKAYVGLSQTIRESDARTQMVQAELVCERKRLEQLDGEIKNLNSSVDRLTQENGALKSDLGAYVILANQKDIYALELEREMNSLTQQREALRRELDSYIALTQYYRNLKVVRVRAFAARIVKGIIRRLKRLIRKGEHG